MNPSEPDPGIAALALSQSVVLRQTVELAGAVQDLVYGHMTGSGPGPRAAHRMFAAAMDALPHAPDSAEAGFAWALRAADQMSDPAAGSTKKVLLDEVERTMIYMAHWGANQAVADVFSAAHPHEAQAMIRSDGSSGRRVRLDHLSMLAKVFRAIAPNGPHDWALKGKAETAFDRAARAAALRAVKSAQDPGHSAFALAAAASAVMIASIPDHPREFLRGTAPGLCSSLSRAILLAGGPQELATAIPAAMLGGALEYPDDGAEASGGAAALGLRMANKWAASRAAISAFQAVYGTVTGAAWFTSRDRAGFESSHGPALEAAGGMDQAVHYAFDPLRRKSFEKMPFDDVAEDVWEFCYQASGHTMAEWVELAREVDYRAFARHPKNAYLIRAYGAVRTGVSEAAAKASRRVWGQAGPSQA